MTGRPRLHAICSLVLLCLFTLGVSAEAWARVGGGRSSGFSGSRSFSRPSPSYNRQARPTPTNPQQAQPNQGLMGSRGGLLRGLAGGLAGGFLGAMLFRGIAGAGGPGGTGASGGLGFLDLLIIGVLIYLLYRFLVKRRRQTQPASGAAYYQDQSPQMGGQESGAGYPPPPPPPPDQSLEQGLAHIRSMEPNFDESFFTDRTMDSFFELQAAFGRRDLTPVRELLTEQMAQTLQKDVDQLKALGRINNLENIAVRSAQIVQAWQEQGQDYVTVYFLANLLDYVSDEKTGQVVEGSQTQPVKFEEYWTFTRPVGPGPWKLAGIEQAT